MKLKEFDLDLPYKDDQEKIDKIMKENNLSYYEATRLDYESNWKEKRRLFRLQTRCISSMFERLFGNIKTEDCWKILVECVGEIDNERILNFSGVYTVQVNFSYNDFITSDNREKKIKTLDLLMLGVRKIIQEKNWEPEPFEKVYKQIIELNYKNEWVWGKPLKSPDKKFTAEIHCIHDLNEITIYIVIRDQAGTIIDKKKIITEIPDDWYYKEHLGKLKWVSNDEVALFNKEGDYCWNYRIF